VAGAGHALAFAPDPLPGWLLAPWQIVLLGVLVLAVWRAPSARSAATRGLCFGSGHFLVGLYWIYISLHVHGYMAAWLSALAVVILAVGLGLFPAAAAALARWLVAQPVATESVSAPASALRALAACLVWAAAWTAFEWLRGTLFTGFPWLNVGYAHVDGSLAGWAPVVGVYGVAFMAAVCAAAFIGTALWQGAARLTALALFLLAILAGVLGRAADWGIEPAGQPLAVRLVQGNVEQSAKFNPALFTSNLHQHLRLARQPSQVDGFRPDVVVLPETAIPVFQDQLPISWWQQWTDVARTWGAPMVTGIALHTSGADGRSLITNSVIGFTEDSSPFELVNGRVPWRYDKAHLVPFGEFIPYGFRWFVDAMVMPMGDFDRGARRQQPFDIGGQHLAFNICYEDVFGEELLPAVRPGPHGEPGASILANVSNLGWFGNTPALPQHLQIARMRSLETGRPSIRATNTGVTAIINARGEVEASLPVHNAGVLDGWVQGTRGLTPYVRWGNLPVLAVVALVLTLAAGARMRQHRGPRA